MEIVKPTANLETLNKNIKDDFYKVPNLSFDIEKLRADLNKVQKKNLVHLELKTLALFLLIKFLETKLQRKVTI